MEKFGKSVNESYSNESGNVIINKDFKGFIGNDVATYWMKLMINLKGFINH